MQAQTMERWTWVLIFGGMLVGSLGIFMLRATGTGTGTGTDILADIGTGTTAGWVLVGVAATAIVAGAVLIVLRSRLPPGN